MAIIYGIDTEQPVMPLMVRDALIECFYEAHCQDTGLDMPNESTDRSYCSALVKKAFAESGGNFDNPTKEDLMRVMEKLVEFSKNFRDPSLVQKHAKEIQQLLDLIS
ncbi:hypothetical protein A2524_01280 [Candidatus Wolfebacteria bacterium RIFOXYD12_FULL_48_21]|uniref:Uncharacterized protein n=1 Tax=Candidatus Wolfebacteria bacterium RIFOXYD1_FULL_48_65 TaxID=1802561 RepID=A0A1F8E0N2_9BACT|nr:MAG: hypothetical protein A2610_03225 [Candidatus Wolfebacteria bacterium RIFOXYD1_FULL_48_65]OGM94440.1 MAG: hypothetical protein A2524_01280 [Candidatus Wolfebacteria bacterium RIFOXYD12_FULL_48_21]OGM97393.1 MAG: hypothetical protein A2532_01925 [Candidatus Wolfebacteria bacterium RIFOXYD2_FULL_48_11]